MKKIIIGCFLLFSISLFSQQSLNFGLQQPQEKNTLPHSRANSGSLILNKADKSDTVAKLVKVAESEYNLTAGWQLCEEYKVTASGESPLKRGIDTHSWYKATVTGTVLTRFFYG